MPFQTTPPGVEEPEASDGPDAAASGSFWCPLGPLGSLGELGSRLAAGVSKLDLSSLGRQKMPLKAVRTPLRWCRCLKVSSHDTSYSAGEAPDPCASVALPHA